MELGSISNNKAKTNGGGVFMEGGKFTLQRGNINDNMLTDINGAGAGVYVGYTSFSSNTGEYVSGTFDMAGGGIYHNHFDISNPYDSSIEAGNFFGCGVYVDDKGTFSKTGGTIYGIIKGGGGWENAPLMNFYDFEINTECYPGYMVYNDWINETQQKECEDEEKENFGTIDNARLPKHRGYAVYYKGTGNNVYSRDKTVGPECNLSMEELSGGGEDEYPTI
ncbi:MAG: hypothetical protein LBH80_03725, partial [Prevotellaceae bacterium]|jgi:hypothetical protein|nr:hypothetical protein [Prevotellaceae bacterium]